MKPNRLPPLNNQPEPPKPNKPYDGSPLKIPASASCNLLRSINQKVVPLEFAPQWADNPYSKQLAAEWLERQSKKQSVN
jgi:hypothetical protein